MDAQNGRFMQSKKLLVNAAANWDYSSVKPESDQFVSSFDEGQALPQQQNQLQDERKSNRIVWLMSIRKLNANIGV
jgi:hypothetical protein